MVLKLDETLLRFDMPMLQRSDTQRATYGNPVFAYTSQPYPRRFKKASLHLPTIPP